MSLEVAMMSRVVQRILMLCCALALVVSGWLVAQDAAPGGKQDGARLPMAITPEREAAVLKFVELHHPELKDVLKSLQSSRPKEYEKAVREIYSSSERIANLKARDPELYDLELANWTLRSRIQLLAAHMAMGGSDDARTQLRELLGKQMDVRAAMLRHEQARTRQRLEQIEKNLARVEADRDQQIQRQMDLLMRSAQSSQAKARGSGKSVVNSPAGKRPGGKKKQNTVDQPAKSKP